MARLETGPTDLILETENRASCSKNNNLKREIQLVRVLKNSRELSQRACVKEVLKSPFCLV